MKTRILLLTAVAALAGSAVAGGGSRASGNINPSAPTSVSSRTFHYTCDGGRKISVSYVNYGADGPLFAVLNWNGQQYGLAQAISASGARYASLYGPTVSGGGLEWWEHQGQADLSTFVGTDTSSTRPLLTNCKPGR
ncbi:MliC family protein [Deinococcus aestuarii]|uniref:MliC family protein n=1 Tax=Deinococcus aestuarii TaxID=2774531 RepID=UPI001C0BA328|nr:MliC family protein [Deinococcus aestuarii]